MQRRQHSTTTRRTPRRAALLWTLALSLGLTMSSSSLARTATAERVEQASLVWTEEDDMTDMSDMFELDADAQDGRERSGVPVTSCPTGFREIARRLCIHTSPQTAVPFLNAAFSCTNQKGRIATHGDLFFVYTQTPGFSSAYNPLGRWIGPDLVGDDQALCGDRAVTSSGDPDITNFEGICNKFNSREYWCVRELR